MTNRVILSHTMKRCMIHC